MRWFNRPPLSCGHINGKKVQDFFCNADRFEDQKASRSKSHNNQPVMLLRLVNHRATWNDVARIYTCTSFIVTCFSCHSGHLSFFPVHSSAHKKHQYWSWKLHVFSCSHPKLSSATHSLTLASSVEDSFQTLTEKPPVQAGLHAPRTI